MIKRIGIFISFITLGILFFAGSASAVKPVEELVQDVDGLYDVAGHPNMKLRVIVHNPKPLKAAENNALVCNLADPDSTSVTPATGWRLPANMTYLLNPNSAPSASLNSNFPTIVSSAFSAWNGSGVNFVRGANTSVSQKGLDGRNILSWGRTSGTALATTYTWYYPATGMVAEVDTIFNKRFNWSWSPYSVSACVNSNTYDVQNILTHELGHWMGLNDAYTAGFVNNTMYGYGAMGEIKKDTLTTGDTLGLDAIYP